MTKPLDRTVAVASWCAQILAAGILLQTLFFKFTGAEESRFIFSTLGIEPWGRIASGVAELLAAVLLLWPPMAAFGAVLSMGVMAGAIFAHLFLLGVVVQGDGGLLFILAVLVFLCGGVVAYLRRIDLPIIGCKLA